MGLSCECSCDYGNCGWWYEVHTIAKPLATKRTRKCVSCRRRISIGDPAYRINRWRIATGDVEERIHGEGGEVQLADWYFCPECGVLYHALEKVNMCFDLGTDDLRDVLREFNAEYAPKGLPGFALKLPPLAMGR